MDKIFNWFSFCFGAIGGILASLLGGIDEILIALLLLCVFDFISGIIKSIITKKLSSEVGFKGILKK
ncbi:MAG: phage holin family protein, partial [Oscillospiraceae bacterium]